MEEYIRKIIYLRKKERGIESSGSGYIRLERKGDELRLHLVMPEENRFGELPVYAVYEKNKELRPLLLGRADGKGEWEYYQFIDTRKMEWYAEDIVGFVVGNKDFYLVGESPDYRGKILYENIIFKKNETKPAREMSIVKEEILMEDNKEKPERQEEQEEQGPEEQEQEEQEQEKQEPPLEAASEDEDFVSEKPFVSQRLLEKMTEMYPFEDDELEWCYGMTPEDFSYFPMEYWHYTKNTFLLQGFYNYRHLLYAHKEGKNYLGVPGQFHRREQFLAGQFGFPLFKATKKKRTTVGDFGYWMKELD